VELYPFGAIKVSKKTSNSKHCLKNAPWPILPIYVKIIGQIFSFVPFFQCCFGFSNLVEFYGKSMYGLLQLLFVNFFLIIDAPFLEDVKVREEGMELPNSCAY